MTTTTEDKLNIYSDYTPRFYVTKYVGGGGSGWGSATGTTGFTIRIASSKTGSALGSLSASATEETGTSYFACTFDTAALVSALAAYLGKTVYVILSKSGDLDMVWKPVRVTDNLEAA